MGLYRHDARLVTPMERPGLGNASSLRGIHCIACSAGKRRDRRRFPVPRAVRKKSAFLLGVANPAGRTTTYSSSPLNEVVSGTAIKIYHTGDEYRDAQSGELVVRSNLFVAEGGVLIRALGISEGNAPLTIGVPSCSPEKARGERVSRTLKFSVIN